MENEDICETYCSNELFNITKCSEEDYVGCCMEHRILSMAYLVPVTVLMIAIFLCGFIGNSCVCLVIARHLSMKTVTNYYLFSLAVSDLLLLVFGLPQELWYYWHIFPDLFGNTMCKMRAFISETTTYASVLTVVAFSIERYVAICHPFRSQVVSGFKRSLTAILVIWIISASCAIPMTMGFKVQTLINYPPNSSGLSEISRVCWLSNEADLRVYLSTISVIFFFVFMAVIAVAYINIGLSIRTRTVAANNIQGHVSLNSREQDRTTMRVLAAVVVAFFICWAPFHLQRVTNSEVEDNLKGPLFVFTGILYYLSATVNPILYNVMSKRYRQAFKETFFGTSNETGNSCKPNTPELSKTSSI